MTSIIFVEVNSHLIIKNLNPFFSLLSTSLRKFGGLKAICLTFSKKMLYRTPGIQPVFLISEKRFSYFKNLAVTDIDRKILTWNKN